MDELTAAASAGEVRGIQDGVGWARERHGVTYTYWGMRRVFARLELRKKAPRPRNPQASAEQVEYKREWAYLNLAINGLTGQLRWDWTGNMKGESIAPVVQQWAEDGVEVVVWDRARGHRGPAYQEVAVKLKAERNISTKTIKLPLMTPAKAPITMRYGEK
jgi:hypothetical protein